MNKHHVILELADGTQLAALLSIEAGYLKVEVGGFLGTMDFRLRPVSIIPICRLILSMFRMKEEPGEPKAAAAAAKG